MNLLQRCAAVIAVVMIVLSAFAAPVLSDQAELNTYAHRVQDGMSQMKSGDYRAARDSFEEAIRYNDAGAEAHLGLGMAYYHEHEDRYAERELKRVLELDPKITTAYEVLGEIAYRNDELETAVAYWEKAVELDPSSVNLRERLARVRKEQRTEKDFNREITSHFLSKYEGREKIAAGRIVLRILEDAYGEVGRALSYYPDREIQVILYSNEQFKEVTDAPGWSAGVYDGKIRIPIAGIEKETPGLRKLLYHEYTHAVVRFITPRCPAWLNEGLAQYFEGKDLDVRQRGALKQMALAGKLPSLAKMEGSFTGLGSDQAGRAYLLSLSATRYMIDAFGLYRVKSVLEEMAAGADPGKAISTSLSLPYDDFERGWKKSLE